MIKASEFKAKCLKLMDEVAENGEEIVITKNGKPVAKLTAYWARPTSFFGADQRTLPVSEGTLSKPWTGAKALMWCGRQNSA